MPPETDANRTETEVRTRVKISAENEKRIQNFIRQHPKIARNNQQFFNWLLDAYFNGELASNEQKEQRKMLETITEKLAEITQREQNQNDRLGKSLDLFISGMTRQVAALMGQMKAFENHLQTMMEDDDEAETDGYEDEPEGEET